MGLWQIVELHDQFFEDFEGIEGYEAVINLHLGLLAVSIEAGCHGEAGMRWRWPNYLRIVVINAPIDAVPISNFL